MPATETVELQGHIVDSLILAKVLDLIVEAGADYQIETFEIGKTNLDPSLARIEVTAADEEALGLLLEQLQVHGANRTGQGDAVLVAADTDGVLPVGFYSTTNLATDVRVDGHWRPVENPEMDCARRRRRRVGPHRADAPRARRRPGRRRPATACGCTRPRSPAARARSSS